MVHMKRVKKVPKMYIRSESLGLVYFIYFCNRTIGSYFTGFSPIDADLAGLQLDPTNSGYNTRQKYVLNKIENILIQQIGWNNIMILLFRS